MNLFIVEDSELVRNQLMRQIGAEPRIRVVGHAETCETAVACILKDKPDAVLLDIALRESSGIDVLSRIRAAGCRSRVLVLTNNPCEAIHHACEVHGISGFYDKSLETSECMATLFSWLSLPDGARQPVHRLKPAHP